MAGKKKSFKDSEESGACGGSDSSPSLTTTSTNRGRYLPMHNSEGELLIVEHEIRQEKNKSNLFLIRSYSLNERPDNLKIPLKLQEFEKYPTLLLDEASPSTPGQETKHKVKEKTLKEEKLDKPSKEPKQKKLKKSKSTYDSTEDLHEFQDILRKPAVISENEGGTASSKRPLTFVSDNPHKPVVKSKTMEDIDTSTHIKRDSFIRHSLQSIRRSFSSSKKFHISSSSNSSGTASSSACSSSSSSSSASSSSDTSSSLKKSKTKTKEKPKAGEHKEELHKDSSWVPTQSGEHNLPYGPEQNHLMESSSATMCLENTPLPAHQMVASSSSASSACSSTSSSSAASAGLAVLPEEDEKDLQNPSERSTSSVSTLAQLPTDPLGSSMAPLQTHTEAQSVQCLNTTSYDKDTTANSSSPPQSTSSKRVLQHQLSIPESIESTSIGCATSSDYSSARSLKHSSTSLAPLQSVPSSTSLRSISPSRRSASSNSSSTAKHEQSPAAATAAGAVAAAGAATTSTGSNSTPPEKEKKRKEVSSSRVKKFQRHFSQVSKDEKLINYFSCALVSDILLQGHLYITDQHFAFYSNVFGYVTKVVIPTSSVTKISKEKTAKIIPNAVGVATADERHVFGSFISREAAFRLMCSVCPPLGVVEILPKDPASIEISEEYSVEDDSSCSISGNESPAQATDNANSTNENHHSEPSQTILRRSVGSSNLSIAECSADKQRHSDIPFNAKTTATNGASSLHSRASAPPAATHHYANGGSGAAGGIGHVIVSSINGPATAIGCATLEGNLTFIAGNASSTTSATTTPTPSSSSSPTTTVMALPHTKAYQVLNKFRALSNKLMVNVKFPTEIHVVYLGVMLTVLLAVFTIFLLYRILDIEAKTSVYRSPIEFNWSGNDDDIFAEALRFQKQLQVKSTEEAQNILKTNLEQIAKVRRSLETLSMLIHDRSSSFGSTTPDDSD